MTFKIFTNKYFYISILGLIVLGTGTLVLMDKVIMPHYTHYNEGITVPDVTRISVEEAETVLKSYGLRYEVAERRANAAFPANYVIDQSPSPSLLVKPNRKIYLTVNTAVRPQVVVPNVENLSLRNAQIQLQNYGLEMGSISYESSRFKNVVLHQSLPQGVTVEKGTTVNLVVSDGLGSKMIEIPYIIGLRLPEVQQKLQKVGLRVGEIRFKPDQEHVPNTVLDFSPKIAQILEGESLNLVVSERYNAIEEIESGVVIDSTDYR